MKTKTSDLVAKIIDTAALRIGFDTDKYYVSVSIYDCGGSWQAWLDYGKSGQKPTKEVFIDNINLFEDRTLDGVLKQVLSKIKNYESSIKLC
jgi:hypothetical protein